MEIFIMFCLLSVAFTGLGEGSGMLPEGPLKVSEGGRIMFTTTRSPSDGPLTEVDWRFGERFIILFNGTANITEPEYEGRISLWTSTGSLELRNVSLNESGQYQVFIKPKGGRLMMGTTRLEVYVPVSNVAVTVGSTDLLEFSGPVHLSCSASGQNLSFLWMNGTSEITAGDGVQITDGGSAVTVVNVTRYDQGPFRCHVSNPVSNDTSDPLHLSISYGPENVTLTSPQVEHFEEGSTVAMSCSADSRPLAFYFWFLNGDKLSDSGPELRLMNIQLYQSGNYSCQAFNNKTLKYETSRHAAVHVHVLVPPNKSPSCSAGCIAGIVVACVVVVVAAAAGGAFCILRKRKKSSSQNDAITKNKNIGSEGQDNMAYSSDMVMTYAEISFDHNNDSGAPPRHNSEMNRTQYTEVAANNSSAPATAPSRRSPPSYEDTLKMKRRAPQDGTAAVHYTQDRKK